jgi:O-antigen/teichoic acid export membrane protein
MRADEQFKRQESSFDSSSEHGDVSVDRSRLAPKISHAALLTASQIAKWSLRLVFTLVVARALGPARLGEYALIFTVIEFLAVASGAGYTDYLTREAAKDAKAGWGLASQLVSLRIALAVPIFAIEIGALWLMRYPHIVLVGTAWMALTIIPRSLTEAVQGVLRGVHRYASHLSVEIVLGITLVAGAVVLAIKHGQLEMAIAVEVLAAVTAACTALALALKYRTAERVHLPTRQLLRTSAVFNVYSFVGTLYDRFDVVLLSRLAGDYVTGIYSAAYRATSMAQIVGYGVMYSLLPGLSRDAFGHAEKRRLERTIGLLMSLSFLIILATMIFASPLVELILGPRYAESALALKILVWATIFRYCNYALNILLLASGKERVFVATSLVSLVTNLVGNLILIPRFGWRGAALMTIVTEVVLLAQNIYWIRRLVGNVGLPKRLTQTSLAFGGALGTTFAAGYLGSTFVVGTACLFLFAAYLVRRGMIAEFAAVWSDSGVLA